MIRIKAVDAHNISEVCRLTANPDGNGATTYAYCNALSIAEAKYDSEMYPNAIYNNNIIIGFFMYRRAENQADTATICRFMLDYRFQHKGFGKKALAYILRGLKIQGVKKVILLSDDANKIAKKLCLSFGFQLTGKIDHNQNCYMLEW